MLKIIKDNKGATAVEFALVAFPLMLIIMGMVEFSLMYYANSVIENSTTIGARLGITGNDYKSEPRVDSGDDRIDTIRKNIIDQSAGLLDPNRISITCEDLGANFDGVPAGARGNYVCGGAIDNNQSCDTGGQGGNVVIYTVSYCWELLTPLSGLINSWFSAGTSPDQILLSSSLVVRNERFTAAPATP